MACNIVCIVQATPVSLSALTPQTALAMAMSVNTSLDISAGRLPNIDTNLNWTFVIEHTNI